MASWRIQELLWRRVNWCASRVSHSKQFSSANANKHYKDSNNSSTKKLTRKTTFICWIRERQDLRQCQIMMNMEDIAGSIWFDENSPEETMTESNVSDFTDDDLIRIKIMGDLQKRRFNARSGRSITILPHWDIWERHCEYAAIVEDALNNYLVALNENQQKEANEIYHHPWYNCWQREAET